MNKNGDVEQFTNATLVGPATVQYGYGASVVPVVYTPQFTAIPVQARRGGKCCGCCCDYRRAVLVVDILVLVFNALAILILATYGNYYMEEEFGEANEPYNAVLAEIIFSLVTAVAAGIGIYGSISYNMYAVGFTGAWLMLNWAASLINAITFCAKYEDRNNEDYVEIDCYVSPGSVAFSFGIALGFMYPHVFFIKEIRQGIMTEENYPQEKFSCCCP